MSNQSNGYKYLTLANQTGFILRAVQLGQWSSYAKISARCGENNKQISLKLKNKFRSEELNDTL